MACYLYFGLPGCGKTTLMSFFALQGVKRYKNVYGNVEMMIDGYTYIDNSCIGEYLLRDCLLLIDEATLFADSRAYKEFTRGKLSYFLQHRHYRADIKLFTQQWDGIDRKIRTITDRVYYVYKGMFTGKWITKYYRIPYGIIIPDPKKDGGGDKLGEIVQGYCKPDAFTRIFCPILFRPMYYKYFDSFVCPPLPELPPEYYKYDSKQGLSYFSPKYRDYFDVFEETGMFLTELLDDSSRELLIMEHIDKLYMRDLEECVC